MYSPPGGIDFIDLVCTGRNTTDIPNIVTVGQFKSVAYIKEFKSRVNE
jgi:hypothetical protein